MWLTSLLVALVIASSAKARCGTRQPMPEQMETARYLHTRELGRRTMSTDVAGIEIDLYYHVIASNDSVAGGYIDASILTQQTQALNERYGPHDITWTQAGAEWIVKPEWSLNQNEFAMKQEIRKGSYADLNVYIFPSIGVSHGNVVPFGMVLMGETYEFPNNTAVGDERWVLDSINLRSDVLVGSAPPHDLGMTLVHESGHWLGLYHTFQGGCEGESDRIDDTPAENDKVVMAHMGPFSCEIGRDSCPGEGSDPITNYMNYSADSCYKEFTKGQEIRIYSQWAEFRAPHRSG